MMSDVHHKRIAFIHEMLLDQADDTFLLFALAKEYDAIGETEQAIERYDAVLTIDPNYLGAYYHLAELLYRAGKTDRAIEVGESGIEIAKHMGAQKDLAELHQLIESF
jgi:tetratricopeptide (TPR) repeat protein